MSWNFTSTEIPHSLPHLSTRCGTSGEVTPVGIQNVGIVARHSSHGQGSGLAAGWIPAGQLEG